MTGLGTPIVNRLVPALINYAATTAVSVASAVNSSVAGQVITFTVTVTSSVPGSGTPGGAVQFVVDGQNLGSLAVLSAAGTATSIGIPLSAGSHTITADYINADGAFLDSSGALAGGQLVNAVTSGNLQNVIAETLQAGSPITVQADPMQLASLTTILSAVNGLQPPSAATTITVDLEGGTYLDQAASPPSDVYLVIQNGTLIGNSPALSVNAGQVEVLNCNLSTATDAPTILISGGNLSLLDDKIQESVGFSDAAIDLIGGTLDLGTANSPGGNTLNINGTGEFVHNTTSNDVPSVGDTFETNGTSLTASYLSFTTLAVSTSQSVYGQIVTLTATVSPDSTGSAAPSGGVDFFDTTTGTELGSVQLSGGIGSLMTSMLSMGNHVISVTYSGDINYLSSLDFLTQTITPAPLTITADNKTMVYGAMLPNLTGTLAGIVNGDNITAIYSTEATSSSDVVAGGYIITATLNDPDYQLANYTVTNTPGVLTVTPANQTITWTNPTDIVYGSALSATQLNATDSVVGPAAAGALIYFPAAGTVLNAGNNQTLTVNAAATTDYTAASASVTINVDKANQAITFTAPASPIVFFPGETVTLSASDSSGKPVTFSIDTRSIGSGSISGSVLTVTSAGSIVLDANQAGDGNYHAAAQVQQTLVVSKANQTITVTEAAPSSAAFGGSFTVEATASSGLPVAIAASGSASGSGSGSATIAFNVAGSTATISFSQAGNANYNPASVVTETVTVTGGTTSTQLISSANPAVYGQPITFTAIVSSSTVGESVPTGSVQFYVDNSAFGNPVSLNATGHAMSLFENFTSGASHTVKAVYTPTGAFVSSSNTLTQTVQTVAVEPDSVNLGLFDLFVGGMGTSNDNVQVTSSGNSSTGSTGVKLNATVNGVYTQTTYSQFFSTIFIFEGSGNDNIQLANGLTINTFLTTGNGNDNVILGNGSNTVTLGNGNDNINAGNGNSVLTVGSGSDNVNLGNGNDAVTLGNGNDNTNLGNGNNVLVEGIGSDNVNAGNGNNLIAAGLGQHNVSVGNGRNILIDGSVYLTESGDTLCQVLNDWTQNGALASSVANIRSRLAVTDNTSHSNRLTAGSGLDWFWDTYVHDTTNRKSSDLLN
ncbi:MAG TPA: Ig-like domain repeat protein [Gemmataceae bacterium]|nr:Ig-like domain repeat protein [Gemmataceae bacterium]